MARVRCSTYTGGDQRPNRARRGERCRRSAPLVYRGVMTPGSKLPGANEYRRSAPRNPSGRKATVPHRPILRYRHPVGVPISIATIPRVAQRSFLALLHPGLIYDHPVGVLGPSPVPVPVDVDVPVDVAVAVAVAEAEARSRNLTPYGSEFTQKKAPNTRPRPQRRTMSPKAPTGRLYVSPGCMKPPRGPRGRNPGSPPRPRSEPQRGGGTDLRSPPWGCMNLKPLQRAHQR